MKSSLCLCIWLYLHLQLKTTLAQSSGVNFADLQTVSTCRTPAGETGTCRSISECPRILSQVRRLQAQMRHCGWKNGVPMVCCPGAQLASEENCARAAENERDDDNDESISGNNPLIVGGRLSAINSRPWMVAIASVTHNPDSPAIHRLVCGATLIGSQHILTAAHCFMRSRNPENFEVYLGSNHLNMTSESAFQLADIIIHHDFKPLALYADIAIVKLKVAVPSRANMIPACLPSDNFSSVSIDGSEALVLGWGSTEYQSVSSTSLRETGLPVIPNNQCDKTVQRVRQLRRVYPNGITGNLICAGHAEGGKDACQGDSGGPMMWKLAASRRWIVIGIVSSGLRCALPGMPGIYTRVTSFRDWIFKNAV